MAQFCEICLGCKGCGGYVWAKAARPYANPGARALIRRAEREGRS